MNDGFVWQCLCLKSMDKALLYVGVSTSMEEKEDVASLTTSDLIAPLRRPRVAHKKGGSSCLVET